MYARIQPISQFFSNQDTPPPSTTEHHIIDAHIQFIRMGLHAGLVSLTAELSVDSTKFTATGALERRHTALFDGELELALVHKNLYGIPSSRRFHRRLSIEFSSNPSERLLGHNILQNTP